MIADREKIAGAAATDLKIDESDELVEEFRLPSPDQALLDEARAIIRVMKRLRRECSKLSVDGQERLRRAISEYMDEP